MSGNVHRIRIRPAPRGFLAALAASIAMLLAACTSAPPQPKVHMVWPEPPEKARIEFVRSIVDDEDLGQDTTASQKLVKFLAGDKPSVNRIVEPMGLAVSADANRLYVSDYGQAAVFVFDFDKKTFLKIGGEARPLAGPVGIALDAQENLYVVEQAKRGVQVFDRNGKDLRFITDESIERPVGVAVDSARNKLYVVDGAHTGSAEHSVKIFDLHGKLLGKIGKEIGNVPGSFLFPTYATLDAKGNLYVTDTLNSRVQMFDPDGKFVRQFGKRGTSAGMFDKPKGVAVDGFGNVYVADSGWSNVQIFNERAQVLLFFGGRGTGHGLMQNPTALAIDKNNRIYVGDLLNHRVGVYKLVNTTREDSVPAASPSTSSKGGKPSTTSSKAAPGKK